MFLTLFTFIIFIAGYCNRPLGLQNRRLKNNQITASSSYPGLPTWRARLHHAQAWCARYNNHNQWIKFDFVSVTKVTGVAVQGRSNAHQWVTRYLLYFSQDNVHWAVYRYKSNDKVRLMPIANFCKRNCFTLEVALQCVYTLARATYTNLTNRIKGK